MGRLKEWYDLALQRQTEYQRLTLSEVHIQFTPDPKLTRKVDSRLNRKTRPGHQTTRIQRLQAIDVRAVAMHFFADRMARTMKELITIAAALDNLPAGVVDFPSKWAMAGGYSCLDEGQCRVPSLSNDVENLALFHRNAPASVAGPGNIRID